MKTPLKTIEDVMHDAAKAADLPHPLSESFKNHEQAATYYRVLARGFQALWIDEAHQNTLLAQKCSDYADQITQCEIDRANLVAMTLERDELDEKYKEAVRDRKEYKKLYEEYKQRYEFCKGIGDFTRIVCDKCKKDLNDCTCHHGVI